MHVARVRGKDVRTSFEGNPEKERDRLVDLFLFGLKTHLIRSGTLEGLSMEAVTLTVKSTPLIVSGYFTGVY